jgi:CheY-like chemotaxis protein
MPRLNGYHATARCRALGFRGCILGVTGNALEEDRRHFVRLGADAVLCKPCSAEQLQEAMAGVVALRIAAATAGSRRRRHRR